MRDSGTIAASRVTAAGKAQPRTTAPADAAELAAGAQPRSAVAAAAKLVANAAPKTPALTAAQSPASPKPRSRALLPPSGTPTGSKARAAGPLRPVAKMLCCSPSGVNLMIELVFETAV